MPDAQPKPQQPSQNLSVDRYDYAADFVETFAASNPGAVVFDIGAGKCPLKEPVETAGLTWLGFDLHPSTDQVRAWDLSEPCPETERKADLVLMLDVIEHLLNPGIGLQNVSNVLKPGGTLVLTMPNPRWSRSRTHHLLTGNLATFTQHDLDWNHHVFPPFPHVLKKLLKDADLEVRDYITLDGKTQWPDLRLSLSYLPLCVEAAGRKFIESRDKSACGMTYSLVSEKVTPA